jgi:hypothetical protein
MRRGAARIAWGAWLLAIGVWIAAFAFSAQHPLPADPVTVYSTIATVLIATSFPTVGAVVASRQPENPVGWIVLGMGALFGLALFISAYAEFGLVVEPGSLPGAVWAGWVGNWIWPVVLAPIGFVLLLFPDGHPPTRRWRSVGWFLGASLFAWFLSAGFAPGGLVNAGYPSVTNPLGIEMLDAPLTILGAVSGIVALPSALASIVSVIVRFRRSRGTERRQLKWLAYAATLVAVTAVVSLSLEGVSDDAAFVQMLQLSLVASLSAVPIATGIAILRHRLYDIDRLISRTIVYVLVTGSLVAVYAGTVFVVSTIAVASSDNLTVAIATLVAAAAFRPLLARVQGLVDRRFYRHKYDAQKTIDAFGSRLREETDLDELTNDLVGVVRTTMQPTHVSVWLKHAAVEQ